MIVRHEEIAGFIGDRTVVSIDRRYNLEPGTSIADIAAEYARTIGSLSGVDTARVHLVMPKRELFSRDKEKPSASVTVMASLVLPVGPAW